MRKLLFILLMLLLAPCTQSQSIWRHYVGVYFTGDAQMYYTGPSLQIGSDVLVHNNIRTSFYAHYFVKDKGDHSFQTWTVAALGQISMGKGRRLYAAFGLACQRTIEEDDVYFDVVNRFIVVPAYKIGYHFLFRKIVISPEINTTGPYKDRKTRSFELFTLPSIGVRLKRI